MDILRNGLKSGIGRDRDKVQGQAKIFWLSHEELAYFFINMKFGLLNMNLCFGTQGWNFSICLFPLREIYYLDVVYFKFYPYALQKEPKVFLVKYKNMSWNDFRLLYFEGCYRQSFYLNNIRTCLFILYPNMGMARDISSNFTSIQITLKCTTCARLHNCASAITCDTLNLKTL